MVRHDAPRGYAVRLAERLEGLAPSNVLQVRICDSKVRRKHGRSNLPAVRAVAYESID